MLFSHKDRVRVALRSFYWKACYTEAILSEIVTIDYSKLESDFIEMKWSIWRIPGRYIMQYQTVLFKNSSLLIFFTEKMKDWLEKLSLQQYTPILEKNEVCCIYRGNSPNDLKIQN